MTSVLRSGARRLLAQAVEMEVTAFIAAHGDLEDDAGRRRVVRHGHHRERQVQTGIGPVAVRCPRVRDRGGSGEAGKIRFTSAILPPYLRRAKSIEELLPWLKLVRRGTPRSQSGPPRETNLCPRNRVRYRLRSPPGSRRTSAEARVPGAVLRTLTAT